MIVGLSKCYLIDSSSIISAGHCKEAMQEGYIDIFPDLIFVQNDLDSLYSRLYYIHLSHHNLNPCMSFSLTPSIHFHSSLPMRISINFVDCLPDVLHIHRNCLGPNTCMLCCCRKPYCLVGMIYYYRHFNKSCMFVNKSLLSLCLSIIIVWPEYCLPDCLGPMHLHQFTFCA